MTDTPASPSPTPQGGDIVLARVGAALRRIRPEERILLGAWLVGYLLVYRSDTGFDFTPVFKTYVMFFAMYIVYVVMATRVFFWLGDAWTPSHPWARRAHAWLWGPPADYPVGGLDRALIGNAPRLQNRTRPTVLAMDLEFVRGVLLLFANLAMYSNIKTRIPMINSTIGDAWFQEVDFAIFGEGLIHSIEQWFANNPGVAEYFGNMYMHDYVWMIALAFILYVRRDVFSFRWLMLSVCLVYILGILTTVAYPSFGPCFMDPDRFEWLRNTSVGRAQGGLAYFYGRSIDAVNAGKTFHAQAFAGIAAFPSLHVGHMVILLVVALRTVPIYALWMAWVAIATSIATVGFGWHYAIDAIGGIVLAAGITEGLYRLMRRWERSSPALLALAEQRTHDVGGHAGRNVEDRDVIEADR